MPVPAADPVGALLRHFTDLRDRTHGGASSRREKEELFAKAVPLIDPYARRALEEHQPGPAAGHRSGHRHRRAAAGRPGAPRPSGP